MVVLVVDQLRADYLERFRGLHQGGFLWLLDNGAYFPDAAYRHAITVTGAGHATVSTGLHPSSHGIVGNSWRERGRGTVYCVADETHAAVGAEGEGRSPATLRSPAFGDAIKAAFPGSKVYSFSAKDRSAVLLGGRAADGAFWYEGGCGCFVSSTYYGVRLPPWLESYNASRPAAAFADKEWTRFVDDAALYELHARGDSFLGEYGGQDTAFPHSIADEGAVAATPFSDTLTLGAALAALQSAGIGVDASPDLLAIGLSATDPVGHRFGPFSQEAMDNHLRLDRELGAFLEAVDREVGLDRTVIALTADHGAVPLVEHLLSAGVAAERFDTADLWTRAADAVARCASGAAEEVVERASGTALYWNEAALEGRGVSRAEASECLAGWLREDPRVDAVFAAEGTGDGDGVATLFANSYFEGRSPHLRLHLKEFVYTGTGTGTGHGSAHAYDREVPVLLAGFGIARGRYPGPAGPEDIAPTLSVLLGLPVRLESDSRVLAEALVDSPG